VLTVLAISYASSMRAYLQQRSHIEDLQAQISQTKGAIAQLEREKARWDDPSYVKEQARLRFGYVDPGETSWQVLDSAGQPIGDEPTLNNPDDVIPQQPTPWWDKAWGSVELAGDPPPIPDPPATKVGEPADKITSSGPQ
jgi:TolA-binding protein